MRYHSAEKLAQNIPLPLSAETPPFRGVRIALAFSLALDCTIPREILQRGCLEPYAPSRMQQSRHANFSMHSDISREHFVDSS